MEGRHFAAGPWFTVEKSGNDWKRLDTVWLSDGKTQRRVHVEIKLKLENDDDEAALSMHTPR